MGLTFTPVSLKYYKYINNKNKCVLLTLVDVNVVRLRHFGDDVDQF